MKVKHPNIESQVNLFRRIFKLIYNTDIFNKSLYKYFPFKLDEFLNDFYKQTDFINESNNLLQFYDLYIDNDFIIIPKLVRSSDDIIIMEYIEGNCMDDLDINEYNKSKIILLFYLFIRNNLIILNINHGDLHKFNWKVSNDKINNIHKIIIYDFGYCFKLNKNEYNHIIELCKLISSYDEKNKYKYINFLKFIFNTDINLDVEYNNRITEPDILLTQVLTISSGYNLMIDKYRILNTLLLLSLIDNYLNKYNINNNYNLLKIKKNLLDAYTFCNTNDIYPELADHMLKEYNMNYKQTEIFQSVQFSDKIKSLL
jgi:predicted unusual protein kinase regulating ubiquinone biosynthesis (AarF/ABC1/UbiB family)